MLLLASLTNVISRAIVENESNRAQGCNQLHFGRTGQRSRKQQHHHHRNQQQQQQLRHRVTTNIICFYSIPLLSFFLFLAFDFSYDECWLSTYCTTALSGSSRSAGTALKCAPLSKKRLILRSIDCIMFLAGFGNIVCIVRIAQDI